MNEWNPLLSKDPTVAAWAAHAKAVADGIKADCPSADVTVSRPDEVTAVFAWADRAEAWAYRSGMDRGGAYAALSRYEDSVTSGPWTVRLRLLPDLAHVAAAAAELAADPGAVTGVPVDVVAERIRTALYAGPFGRDEAPAGSADDVAVTLVGDHLSGALEAPTDMQEAYDMVEEGVSEAAAFLVEFPQLRESARALARPVTGRQDPDAGRGLRDRR